MKELGITKGEWYVKFMQIGDGDSDFWVKSPVNPKVYYGTDIMGEDYGDHNGYPREQRLADAKLIADAGNTAQKCGMLPSEILRQRDRCLMTLSNCRETIEMLQKEIPGEQLVLRHEMASRLNDIEAAIKSTEQ